MSNNLVGKYFVRKSSYYPWVDVSILFSGVNILGISGMNDLGEAINVYRQQWMDGSTDFAITSQDGVIRRKNVKLKMTYIVGRRYYDFPVEDGEIDLESDLFDPLSFSVGEGYKVTESGEYTFYDYGQTSSHSYTLGVGDMLLCTDNTMPTFVVRRKDFDECAIEDAFKSYMTDTDVWIRSSYFHKQSHVVVEEESSPTSVKLHRGTNSRIVGELTFQCLDTPTRY